MNFLTILGVIGLCASSAAAAELESAFAAFKRLPPWTGARVAKIAGCEGAPLPDRWHFVVYEPDRENCLRDYVVSGGRIVAVNAVSQFDSVVYENEILPPGSVRLDSQQAAATAYLQAAFAGVNVARMDYELRNEVVGKQPAWKLRCFDSQGRLIGLLIVDAGTGAVIVGEGFAAQNLVGEPVSGGSFAHQPVSQPPPAPPAAAQKQDGLLLRSLGEIEVRRALPVIRGR